MKGFAAAFVGISMIAVASGGAQSPATVVDARTVSERPDGKSDTLLTHTISSGSRSRVEQSGAIPPPILKMKADIEIISERDGKMSMIYVDTTDKLYAEMDLSGMMAMAMSMSSVHLTTDTTAAGFTVDSVGPGPLINGHKTVHFRTHTTSRMTIAMFGDTSSVQHLITTDLYLAPDVKSGDNDSSSRAIDSAAVNMMKKMVPMVGDQMMSQAQKAHARLAKYGTALRTVLEMTDVSAAGTKTRRQTIDVLRYEHTVVSDSIFSPPAGYKKVSLMDLMGLP
jgi:hypothetical protein